MCIARRLFKGSASPLPPEVHAYPGLRRNMALRHALGVWRRRGADSALTGALAAPALSMTGHAVGAAHNTGTQVGPQPLCRGRSVRLWLVKRRLTLALGCTCQLKGLSY